MPVCRNWQTTATQNRVPLACGFESHHRHQKNVQTGGVNDMKKMKNALFSSIGTPVSFFTETVIFNFNE